MKYSKLGNTDINVSRICLGTMTWGEQNTQADGFAQMDFAVESGINFFDAAEMYPVPPKPETQGKTEEIIGNWFEKTGKRDKIILATKVVGHGRDMTYMRDGYTPRLDRKNIEFALNNSLKRLKTDYIDLYQLHWPDRETNYFGQLGYTHNAEDTSVPLKETLEVLGDFMKQGKIRNIGLSNETPWGVLDSIRAHEIHKAPRIVSIQNPYSLLNRSYEVGMAEVSIRENCGLLAYSPLAFGVLSGKYLNGKNPGKTRLNLFARFTRYKNEKANAATARYAEIAKNFNISPAQLALAFVNSRPFLTSNIIGATSIEQLTENIGSINIDLPQDAINEIEKVYTDIPNPCP